ncbi:MAG: hypothetical protein CM15mP102_04400 [Flavobacteriales bacterium]|nr:MAG: hypothetical protein CM15mP102_04400 [Flavobacteriales bacterium]
MAGKPSILSMPPRLLSLMFGLKTRIFGFCGKKEKTNGIIGEILTNKFETPFFIFPGQVSFFDF